MRRRIRSAVRVFLLGFFPGALSSSEFLNFESGPVRPLALSPAKAFLFAANTPDNRLEIFRVTPGGLEWAGAVFVGLEPVAVTARSETEVYVVNHLSDSVSVVDVSDPARAHVKATLLVGDEPRDIVLAGPARDKVFITTAHRGQNNPSDPQLATPGVGRADVWVFDAKNLKAEPHVLTLFCDTPRGLAVSPDGTRVYAAAFHSGNQTTSLHARAVTDNRVDNKRINDGFSGLRAPAPSVPVLATSPAPETGLIVKFHDGKWLDEAGRDWSPRMRFNLPDKDVFIIDATQDSPVEIGSVAHVGTVLFNLAVNPATGKVYVSNLESRNHVRFEPLLSGHVAENRISILDGATVTSVHLNPHIDYAAQPGNPDEIARSLAFPLGMEFTSNGQTLYVAAFGSRKVGVLSAEAQVLDRIEVGGGPSGLALDEEGERLYVLNRFEQTISLVDTRARKEIGIVPLPYNPEPPAVREGRPILYDARNSAHGDAACASCHIFADLDSLAWDLGEPGGQVEPNPLLKEEDEPASSQLQPFHPLKGPMTTQSLRGLRGTGPLHWRGDRNPITSRTGTNVMDTGASFMTFRPAYQSLLGKAEELPVPEMEKLRDFILTLRYPPNPIAKIDGTLSQEQARGRDIFENGSGEEDGDQYCANGCHNQPLTTTGTATVTFESVRSLPQTFKVPQLRNLYQKVGMFGFALPGFIANGRLSSQPAVREPAPTLHLGDQVRGFGYFNDGSVPTLLDIMTVGDLGEERMHFQGDKQQKMRQVFSFVMALNTGLEPVVGQQVTLEAENLAIARPRFDILRKRAEAKHCDLVVHGLIGGRIRGFSYLRLAKDYASDRSGERYSEGDLLSAVEAGAFLTATAVHFKGGKRLGIDRDDDGWLDLDEVEAGSDPLDPARSPRFDPPENLAARETPAGISLTWSPGSAEYLAVDGYNIYRSRRSDGRGGIRANDDLVTGLSYVDAGAIRGTHYYVVKAVVGGPEVGLESAPSNQVSVTTGSKFFLRGNCDGDGEVDLSDPVFSLRYLFAGGETPLCLEACDSNSDGQRELSDAVHTLNFLFGGGQPPGAFPECEASAGACAREVCPGKG